MYQCTIHRKGQNVILGSNNLRTLRIMVEERLRPGAYWGMLRDGSRYIYPRFTQDLERFPRRLPDNATPARPKKRRK
jgi:hypothetical protein